MADREENDPYRIHRPCPFVSCRYHLHADVGTDGVVTVLSTEDMPLDIAHTCVLDVVDEHPDGVSREEVAQVLRVSEERTRISERRLEAKVRGLGTLDEWRGHECARGDEESMG